MTILSDYRASELMFVPQTIEKWILTKDVWTKLVVLNANDELRFEIYKFADKKYTRCRLWWNKWMQLGNNVFCREWNITFSILEIN